MQEVRVYNSTGNLIRTISVKDLEKRSKAFIDSIISKKDKDKIRKFKYDFGDNSIGTYRTHNSRRDCIELEETYI
jgi:hypothetical protein